MIGTVYSAGLHGFETGLVKVEVDISKGLPGWTMVGLPEKTVQESRDRVGAALRNSGIHLEPRKTTINLAPALLKKSGNQYDLPIAVGLLIANGVISKNCGSFLFVGELTLTGDLKPIHGAFLFASLAKEKKFQALILPKANAVEAALASDLEVIGCDNIAEVIQFINEGVIPKHPAEHWEDGLSVAIPAPSDFAEVRGQAPAKRALEIAAAGNHHLLMIGPPGSGKTMLASRLPAILPALTHQQAIEITRIYSALGLLNPNQPLMSAPPFRAPHHSTSYAGLVGGGNGIMHPGEITLAHHGILFLDELPEFRRDGLQMLRQPLESGNVTLIRTKYRFNLPARFQLIAAMNPCPCGYLGHPKRLCTCDPGRIHQYREKISGPLMDRFDIQLEIPPLTEKDLFDTAPAENSMTIRERVLATRELQKQRYQEVGLQCNAELSHNQLEKYCRLKAEALQFFRQAFQTLNLSARAHDRILKVARTIADLAGQEIIGIEAIAEAIQYRCLDREQII